MIFRRVFSNFAVCLVLTVVIEAIFAFILGRRQAYEQLIILLTNLFTNPLLNIVLTLVSFYLPHGTYYFFLVPLEILVVVGEGFIYKKVLPNKKLNPFLFSFILNACSYFIGSLILKIF